MYYRIFQLPILSFVFKTANAIPIAGVGEDPALMDKAFVQISDALAQGDLVCIFPEGKLTENGEMSSFKSGVSKIIERDPVPVIPLALRGLWGSFFSRRYGNAMTRWFPRGWFSKIELVAGEAIDAANASRKTMHQQVSFLRGSNK